MALQDDLPISKKLSAIVGEANVIDGINERTFYSTDIAARGETCQAVVRVTTVDHLSRVVALCTGEGMIVIPRGGGFSYTGGYTPIDANSVMIDLRGLDQIVEINEEDMYVRAGTGCTWRVLYETLKARGYRTPYFGPMSGYNATVGGALSQGSFFLGSTEYGTTAESVLSLEVVLANGDVIHTGSDSSGERVGPFYRNYGPDLTGLFLADSGALGFKAIATLKLIKFPPHQAYGSFSFDSGADAAKAMSDIGRSGLTAEAYCWDPYFVEVMSQQSTGLTEDFRFLLGAIRNAGGLWDGLTAAARIAINGKRIFKPNTFIVHVMIDDHSAAGAANRLKQVRALALAHNAKEIGPTIPRALRGTPFTDFNVPERRTPLRGLPTNSLYPHSRLIAADTAIRACLADNAEEMARHDVKVGVIFFAVGRQAVCIEPLLYWNDEEHFQHDRVAQTSDLNALSTFTNRPEATQFVMTLREKLKDVMKANGAVHVQIGKAYDYLPSRETRVAALVRDLKSSLDPDHLVNPGSLGL